jgi:transposase
MQTSNTAEMVTISRAEYVRLQQKNAQLESTRVRLEAERIKLEAEHARLEAKLAAREQEQAQVITSLTLQNEWLLEQLKLSKKKLFGRSSEQEEQMVMEQLSFTYDEAEA